MTFEGVVIGFEGGLTGGGVCSSVGVAFAFEGEFLVKVDSGSDSVEIGENLLWDLVKSSRRSILTASFALLWIRISVAIVFGFGLTIRCFYPLVRC